MMYILKIYFIMAAASGLYCPSAGSINLYLFKRKAAGKFAAALITLLLYFASLMPTAQLLTHGWKAGIRSNPP